VSTQEKFVRTLRARGPSRAVELAILLELSMEATRAILLSLEEEGHIRRLEDRYELSDLGRRWLGRRDAFSDHEGRMKIEVELTDLGRRMIESCDPAPDPPAKPGDPRLN
jgi:predicted ArsR family transcriptional regulator